MKRLLIGITAVALSLCCLAGCNLGGPSKKEVTAALDAAMRAFTESVEEQTPEIANAYSNALDMIFRNEDESLIHHMNVLVSDEDVTVYGDCEIEEYQDYDSDYLISGKLNYELLFPRNSFPNGGFGIMEGELTLSGGKVETIEFSLSVDEYGELEEFLVSANGKDIDLSEQDSLDTFLRQISRQLPG